MRPLILLLMPLVAVAAPVPKDGVKAKIEKQYGKMVDPKGDSTFDLDGDKLTITLPAGEPRGFGYVEGLKRGDPDEKFDHTPRVEFTQTGDFTLTVRVHSPLTEDAKPLTPESASELGGGFRFNPKNGSWYRFGVMQSRPGRGKQSTIFPLDTPGVLTNSGSGSGTSYAGLKGETIWLRATRSGEVIKQEASIDGAKWKEYTTTRCVIADDTITVSLYALHHSDTKHTVTFDQLKVETPNK